MSFWLTTKRVAKYGLIGFIRNGFVSLSAVLIMTITLFVVALMIIGGAALDASLKELSSKVDVNVYFATNATEDQVVAIKSALEALPEVAAVGFTSREQALADFRERHKNELSTIQALDQLSDNPLGSSLSIRAKDASQYPAIASFLDAQQAASQETGISKVNFTQNKTAFERLSNFMSTARTFGLALAAFLAIASILIAFNTIRLAIYTSRDEIGVMNIVGAAHWYVRGPFMIAGVLYGIISAIIVTTILYPTTAWMGPGSQKFLGSFNVFDYYTASFANIFLTILGMGITIGALSSYLAVRRYLRT